MSFKQFFPISVMIAVLAFVLLLVELAFKTAFNSVDNPFILWVAFQAWAMYFMAGCTPKNGLKVLLGYAGGCAAATVIVLFAGSLGFAGSMAFPLSILVMVVPIICMERVPMFDFIPAWFVGSGAFFAIMTIDAYQTGWGGHGGGAFLTYAIEDVLSCAVGLCFGVMTVIGRGKYEAMLAAKAPAVDAPADDA